MFSYVYNEGNFHETNKLYPHDIALLLDPKEKSIYLWEGPRSTESLRKESAPHINKLKEKFPKFAYQELGNVIPLKIQGEIDKRLDLSFEETQKIDKSPPFRVFEIFSIFCFIMLGVSFIFLLRPIIWDLSPDVSGVYTVLMYDYSDWIKSTTIVLLVSSIFFIILLVISLFTGKIFVIMTGIIGVSVEIGTYLYIKLNLFLFNFLPDSPIYYYNIYIGEILLFVFLVSLGVVSIVVPMVITLLAIKNDTIPISWEEWKEKRRKSSVDLNKVSITQKHSKIVVIDSRTNKGKEKGRKKNKGKIVRNTDVIDKNESNLPKKN